MLARAVDVLQVFRLLWVHSTEHFLAQDFRKTNDGVQRRAQLVRHVGQKLRLVLVCDFELHHDRCLLLQRGGQFQCSLLDLLLQLCIRLLKLAGHVIELACQGLEFVATTNDDRFVQLSSGKLLCPALYGLDRMHHAPRHIKACQHGKGQPRNKQQAGSLQRRIQGRKGFNERLLHQHCPAQRRDAHIGGEHFLALRASRNRNRRPAVFVDAPGRTNLWQFGEVLLLQDIADVRMRDQSPAAVHHIGKAFLADADAGDHVPDELQVDLGQSNGTPAAANRDGHVRLAPVTKVHGAEIRFTRLGLQKLGAS